MLKQICKISGCKFKTNCPFVVPGPIIGGMPSEGLICKIRFSKSYQPLWVFNDQLINFNQSLWNFKKIKHFICFYY